MDSDGVNYQALLKQVTYAYREQFLSYRGDHGILDAEKWFEALEVDYILEAFLANLTYTLFICEKIMDQYVEAGNSSDLNADFMPDYDMGYQIAEDCTEVISFAEVNGIEVRNSLVTELFYAHIQYFNFSNAANRHGWLDVNKRLLSSMVRMIQFQPQLEELLDEWAQVIDAMGDMEESELEELNLLWKAQFISAIREYIEPQEDSLSF